MGGETHPPKLALDRERILDVYKAGPEAVISLITYLADMYEALSRQNEVLAQRIKELEERLRTDSHNSNKPPSSDGPAKRPYPARKPTGKKPGGQNGHRGQTLRMTKTPDKIVIHEVEQCAGCGKPLKDHPAHDYERRQVFDVPPVAVEVTEHRAEIKDCPECGQTTVASFPAEVAGMVQYGERLNAYAVYLKNYALLPYGRTAELFEDLFGVPLSEGTLVNITHRCAEKVGKAVQQIKEKLKAAEVIHCDETGVRISKRLYWLHGVGTQTLTYYDVQEKRGSDAMDCIGILEGYQGIAVHDHWGAYWKYGCVHALCNAHHLRELTFVWEMEDTQVWAKEMIEFLREAKKTVDGAKERGRQRLKQIVEEEYQRRYRMLIAKGMKRNPPPIPEGRRKRGRMKKSKARNLLERLSKRQEETLRFLTDFRVAFDNNQGERDLRMMKVQQKISGTFRSLEGAAAFCRIRSYISTARKHELNVIEAISSVFAGRPLLLSHL